MTQEQILALVEALKSDKEAQKLVEQIVNVTPKVDFIVLWIWLPLLLVLIILGGLFLCSNKNKPVKPLGHLEMEAARLTHGFWLIIAGLVLTLGVVIVMVSSLSVSASMTDVIAVITSVSGVVGTLTASFFGIQAAGAGRSQAMSALNHHNNALDGADTVITFKLDPTQGPRAGGTVIAVTGNGLTGATAINFGALQAEKFEFVNDGLLRAIAPAAPAGVESVAVVVTFPSTKRTNLEVGRFSYSNDTVGEEHDGVDQSIVQPH